MHKPLKTFFIFVICTSHSVIAKPSMLLLNPGKADESFWRDVDTFANAAAERLNLDFNIFHAERNNYLIIREVERLITNKQLPDYLLVVNERKVLPKLFTLLEGQDVYLLVILNDLTDQQKAKYSQNKHWQKYLLTRLIPDNYWIGQQTAKALIAAGKNQPGEVLIISGDRTTPASIKRQAGATDYFNSQAHIRIRYVAYADWDEQISYQKSNRVLSRTTQLKYIWTANDLMAFGSLRALKDHDLIPGKDVFVSTINTSDKVLALKASKEISVLGGGHFTAAGWALVMANHHSKGKTLPPTVDDPLFQLIEPETEFYKCLVSRNWKALPFERIHEGEQGQYLFKVKNHQAIKNQ